MSTLRAELPTITLRRGPTAAGVVRGIATMVLAVGVVLAGFVAYQFGVTSFFAQRAQGGLLDQVATRDASVVPYVSVERPPAPVVVPEGLAHPDAGAAADPIALAPEPTLVVESVPPPGNAIGRITIPAAGVDWAFVEGVDRASLRSGAGHMPGTALPGQPGNAVISGHRTTYGAPFFHLDRLVAGDLITVESGSGIHTYQVVEVVAVAPTDTWVTGQWDGAWLTLTTCNPVFSSRERLVVVSRLVDGPNAGVILAGS